MNVLFLVQKNQLSNFDQLYSTIQSGIKYCDLIRVSSKDQTRLKKFLNRENIDLSKYDRVILFLRYKKMMKQIKFVRTIPNLVILELDACQNYCESKYNGRFSSYFSKIPWVRILCTGKELSQKLRNEGYDAQYFTKAYDSSFLKNLALERDIELGFIGSLRTGVYKYRKQFLEELSKKESLFITKTQAGDEYLNMLNRIKFFVSADIPFGEYMIKNFEAMACGCVLLTWSQSDIENEAVGFIDMQNVVLFKTMDELQDKLHTLRNNPELCKEIAANGQKLVNEKHTWIDAGNKIIELLQADLRKKICVSSYFGLKKTYHLAQ